MLNKYVKGKVYVFIDVENVFYAQRTLGWKISYEKLMKYLKKECEEIKCFAYTGIDENNSKQKKFLDMLDIIDLIKKAGKRAIIISTRGRIAKELLERAKFIDLRKLKNEISQ